MQPPLDVRLALMATEEEVAVVLAVARMMVSKRKLAVAISLLLARLEGTPNGNMVVMATLMRIRLLSLEDLPLAALILLRILLPASLLADSLLSGSRSLLRVPLASTPRSRQIEAPPDPEEHQRWPDRQIKSSRRS
ncbi:hypothetical protein ZWY2020_045048 [Hordeum vulgare]|nr:hypothetical protein ZWY2020_045048 [Hordeum vulgare]